MRMEGLLSDLCYSIQSLIHSVIHPFAHSFTIIYYEWSSFHLAGMAATPACMASGVHIPMGVWSGNKTRVGPGNSYIC